MRGASSDAAIPLPPASPQLRGLRRCEIATLRSQYPSTEGSDAGRSPRQGLATCGIATPRARNIQNGRRQRGGHCEELQATRQSPSSEGPGAVRLPRQGLAISRIGGHCDPRSAAVLGKRVDIARSFRRRGNLPAQRAAVFTPHPEDVTLPPDSELRARPDRARSDRVHRESVFSVFSRISRQTG